VSGELSKAMACFDDAIDGARDNGYIQEEALANELAARFYLAQGRTRIAQTYLHDAHYAYVKWGAAAKAQDLQARYPQLLNRIAYSAKQMGASGRHTVTESTFSGSTGPFSLDVMAIMHASRAISEEIVLARLLKRLMQTILESAGAEQGRLLLEEDGEWRVQAAGRINEEIQVLQSDPIAGDDARRHLPQTLIDYVRRSGKNVVLDNAEQVKQFRHDPYITSHRPKSVLCVPLLHQGNLRAIVYLENNLIATAFTEERVEMVRLLCAQAAISLENAQLYAEQAAYTQLLEQRVAERTVELQRANQELELLANLDGLTQLANRRRFDEYLAQEWRRSAREQAPLAMVLCDVDYFKEYNDYYGHQEGDDCLKQMLRPAFFWGFRFDLFGVRRCGLYRTALGLE
jgi:GAF domain-containing protein